MAAPTELTDEALRDYLRMGLPQNEIAKLFKLTKGAISQRVKKLERQAVAKHPEKAIAAHTSLWNTRVAAEENYARALALLDECEGPGDKARVLSEIRQHLQFAMAVMETLYNIQEVQAFQEEVLTVLEECEPGLRERIISRLREKRTIRAAFLPH